MEDKNINSVTNVNGASNDDDTTCSITNVNCLDEGAGDNSITNLNGASDDTTCSITNVNCE